MSRLVVCQNEQPNILTVSSSKDFTTLSEYGNQIVCEYRHCTRQSAVQDDDKHQGCDKIKSFPVFGWEFFPFVFRKCTLIDSKTKQGTTWQHFSKNIVWPHQEKSLVMDFELNFWSSIAMLVHVLRSSVSKSSTQLDFRKLADKNSAKKWQQSLICKVPAIIVWRCFQSYSKLVASNRNFIAIIKIYSGEKWVIYFLCLTIKYIGLPRC